jgi:hypothetical protein
MAAVTAKRREKRQVDQPSDAWLWPTALLLTMAGWGQALWIGERTAPKGLAPLWLLLWAGIGVAGCALPIYWFARRWPFVAWVATIAWVLVPSVYGLADRAEQGGENWLYGIPLLLLLLFLLGAGLSGAMMTVGGLAQRLWPGPAPKVRPLREGLWAGLFAVICGWLLSNGAFALVPAALLASALILIETFFVIRESPQA